MRIRNIAVKLTFSISMSLLLATSARAAGDLVFDINYVDECEEVSPNVANFPVTQHVVVTLHDGNRVTERRNWQSPRQSGAIATEGAMGAEVTAGRIAVAWHVQSQNSLIRYRTFPQHVEELHIAVSGQSCKATVQHRLKPGFNTFERFGRQWEEHFFSSIISTGITCAVTPQ